jgi:hypothetical protein
MTSNNGSFVSVQNFRILLITVVFVIILYLSTPFFQFDDSLYSISLRQANLRTKYEESHTFTKIYRAIDYKSICDYIWTRNSTLWLQETRRVQLLPSNRSDLYSMDLIVFEPVSNDLDLHDNVKYLINNKAPSVIAMLILNTDLSVVPDNCDNVTNTYFFAVYLNRHSNCHQMQIPYYASFQFLPKEILQKAMVLNEIDFYEKFNFGERKILTGFVGSRGTYEPRHMLAYFSKYQNVYLHFNDEYWGNFMRNQTYLDIAEAEHHKFLQTTIFSFCPRGYGISSLRLLESIAYGAIPVLIDDEIVPFNHPLNFAIRFQFPKQSLSEPYTNNTLHILDGWYTKLQHVANNPKEIKKRRIQMLEFYRDYLAVDLKSPETAGTFPYLPFSSFLLDTVQKAFKV